MLCRRDGDPLETAKMFIRKALLPRNLFQNRRKQKYTSKVRNAETSSVLSDVCTNRNEAHFAADTFIFIVLI